MREASQKTEPRPEGLPEKFKTVADLVNSYSELEKKLGSKTEPTEKTETKAETKPDTKPAEKAEATAAQQETLKPFFEEFAKNGKLSDESYKALEAKGISKDVVDAYQRSVQAQDPQKILESIGGKEQFEAISQWSVTHLSAEERSAYNSALAAGGLGAELALKDLKARMDSTLGVDPSQHISGKSAPASGKFQSAAEIVKAMSDPRYQYDEAYRSKVAALIP
jgi:hypothetical protein